MNRVYMCFPGGKRKCLTLSYDDGQVFDRRLVEIMNRHGIRGTFNLISGRLGKEPHVGAGEVKTLYAGHEVASHTLTHPNLIQCPGPAVLEEITADRRNLEALAGYAVRGFAYPYGTYNDEVVSALRGAGIAYARTVESTHQYFMPREFLHWQPTCHHDDHLLELGQRFLDRQESARLSLMYVWGHSFEFDRNGNWQLMEDFCRMMAGHEDIWYAANIEIVDAVEAFRRLRFSQDNSFVMNPSAQPVWIEVNGAPVEIPGGAQINLQE